MPEASLSPGEQAARELAGSIQARVRAARRFQGLPVPLAYALTRRAVAFAGHNSPPDAAAQRHGFEQDWCRATLSHADPGTAWQAARQAYAASLVNLHWHRERLARIARRVCSRDPAYVSLLAEPGGALVTTFHHDFHHTLFALTGAAGRTVRVIAAPEDSSPLFPWLGELIHAQHRDCALHFSGGDYLFTQDEGSAGLAVAHALRRGELVFSLHDVGAGTGVRSEPAQVFGRAFAAPSGALELAMRLRRPVYFAALVWLPERQGYHVHAQRLTPDPARPLAAYTAALEALVRRHPWAWTGWQWVGQWPAAQSPHA